MILQALRLTFCIVATYVGSLLFVIRLSPQNPIWSSNQTWMNAQNPVVSTRTPQPTLPQQYQEIYDKEWRNWVGNVATEEFYSSPQGWERYAPGEPLRLQAVDTVNFTNVPRGLPLYRLLYVSLDHNDKSVPASAFVLFPYARPEDRRPFQTIAWAHGTAGIERQCAPSNQRNLYYNFDGPVAMALRGYAVVAPDYAGLGSDTTYGYLSAPTHAADVSFAVIAARTAFPSRLTQEWVTVGHSEGGMTAWAVNEREMDKPTGGFRGAVSIAPSLQPLSIIRYGITHGGLANALYAFYVSYTLSAIARFDQSVDVTQYYSDLGMERARLATIGCILTAQALFTNLTFSEIYKDSSWLDSAWATSWQNRMGVKGNKPLAEPLLLVQGLADTAVYPNVTKEIFEEHCNSHPESHAQLNLYPHMDHDPVLFASQFEVFRWIEDRFKGQKVLPGCPIHVVHAA